MADKHLWSDKQWADHYAGQVRKLRREKHRLFERGTLTPDMQARYDAQMEEYAEKQAAHADLHKVWMEKRG